MQIELNLPPYSPQLREGSAASATPRHEIYDPLRRRWVALTPEEWVRQHFVHFLADTKGYPAGRIANEVSLRLNGTLRRCDTVVFDTRRHPLLVVEYKAPSVPLTCATLEQAVRYNLVMRAPYIILSNGLSHHCCRIDYPEGSAPRATFLSEIPAWSEIAR